VFLGAGGGVGHLGIQLAKAMGFQVISVDSGAAKETLCKELGFPIFIDYLKVESVSDEVRNITGGDGAHAVFVTPGTAKAYESAPLMLRVGGKIMCIGQREFLCFRSFG